MEILSLLTFFGYYGSKLRIKNQFVQIFTNEMMKSLIIKLNLPFHDDSIYGRRRIDATKNSGEQFEHHTEIHTLLIYTSELVEQQFD